MTFAAYVRPYTGPDPVTARDAVSKYSEQGPEEIKDPPTAKLRLVITCHLKCRDHVLVQGAVVANYGTSS